jgi:FAD/FMN-containing dehydrogenase
LAAIDGAIIETLAVNFTSDDAAERVRQAYTEGQWNRLTALKAKYDPTNFFRMNANILAG